MDTMDTKEAARVANAVDLILNQIYYFEITEVIKI